MSLAVDLLTGCSVVAGVLLCWLGYRSHSRHDEPGSTAFGAFAAGWGLNPLVGVASEVLLAGAGTVSGFLWVVVTVPWFLFALRYTGTAFGRRTSLALVAPLVGLVPWLLAVASGNSTGLFEALGIMVFSFYSALAIVGALLVVRATRKYGHLSFRLGLCLAVAGVLPAAVMNAFGILVGRTAEWVPFGIYAGGLVGTLAAVGLGLFYYDMFDATPAAGTLGERAIPRETDDRILIVDDDGRVITRNAAAERTLPAPDGGPIGAPIGAVLGVGIDDLRDREAVELQTRNGARQFDPQVTALTDQHDRRLGAMVSLRDVTDRELRRQRLEVLNRLLRHNLRNRVGVIKANVEAVADEVRDDDLRSHLETTTDAADTLQTLGRKAKSIEDLLSGADRPTKELPLGEFLDGIATQVTDRWPDATITVDDAAGTRIETDPETLGLVVENLLENAVEHSDREQPTVELRVEPDEDAERYPVTVVVADDGPGIPEREVEVLREGTETPLKHGSGVGLWVTNWAVTDLGGDLTFERRNPRGTVVRVRLPHQPLDTEPRGQV